MPGCVSGTVLLQVESHAAGVVAAKAAAAEKAAAAAENGASARPIDEAVVEENDEYEVPSALILNPGPLPQLCLNYCTFWPSCLPPSCSAKLSPINGAAMHVESSSCRVCKAPQTLQFVPTPKTQQL